MSKEVTISPENKSQNGVLSPSETDDGKFPNAAHNQVPREWNGILMPFPQESSVLDFFRVQVQANPQGTAVKEGERFMSYRELDLHSNRVANELLRRGLRLEEAVAILLPSSCEFLAAVLGALKAGGSYVPIDLETPAKRLEFLLGDSKSQFVLTDSAGIARLREWTGSALDLPQIIGLSGAEADKNPGVPANPNRRVYVIYTSGSTGQPKGVEIEHRALTNLVCYYRQRFNLTARDRASMLAYVAFDASVADIWPVLCVGGTVVIPSKKLLQDPDGLIEWLQSEQVTLTFIPTGLAEILFAREWPERMKLRFLITGGDRLRVRPKKRLSFTVINGYGPTENTVFSTFSELESEAEGETPPPIGRPTGNVKVYVLDEQLQPVPVGEAGELYVGGAQVARGYLGRPELTQERFMKDPFTDAPEARMYRSGDWARWRPDGELDFLGRKDGQIQIRGCRVELGEVEAILFAHGSVRQVCCVPRLNDEMPVGVVAHIVPQSPGTDPSEALKIHLNARLPDYMVPSEFVIHERLPLTPQGKADRSAMMAMKWVKTDQSTVTESADGLEKALAVLWQSILPMAKNSPPEATFAYLGGDSLLAIRLMLGVEEIIRQRLELSLFLLKPTFAGLCEAARTRLARTGFEPVLVINKRGKRPPLFCLYGINGDIDIYFNLVDALGNDQPVIGIRSPALADLSRLPQSMEEAAAEVVPWIRKVQPQGVPALVGYSWAGQLAFEVARQLFQAEGISCFTALIGSEAPTPRTNLISRSKHFGVNFLPWATRLATDRQNRWRRLKRWQGMIRGTKQKLVEAASPVAPMPEWATSPISRHLIGLMEKYRPPTKSNLAIDLFRELDDYKPQSHPLHFWHTSHLPDGGWNHWTGKRNRVYWVPGSHETIIKAPLVSGLAQSMRQAMDRNMRVFARA